MAVEGPQPIKESRRAAADLSALQYYFVKYDANGDVVAITGLTDMPVGVLQNNPKLGATAELVVLGLTKVSANAAIAAAGTLIGPSADGQAETKVGIGTATTDWCVGYSRESAGGANELVSCWVNCIPSGSSSH